MYELDRAICSLGKPLEIPVEVDVLTDPRFLIVASNLLENTLTAELRSTLGHARR